jgi:hypothetical protein
MEQMLQRDRAGRTAKIQKPAWANDPRNMLSPEDVEAFQDADLAIPPRMMFEGDVLRADIVTRGDGDLIYHFYEVNHDDFRTLLAEVVESHFGSTDSFRVDQVIEMPGTWGLLAKGVRSLPLFNLKFYTEDFLWLLDKVLKETR